LDINDQATGQAFSSTIPVSIDALQEVRTVIAGETADYGRSSGGGINLVTKVARTIGTATCANTIAILSLPLTTGLTIAAACSVRR